VTDFLEAQSVVPIGEILGVVVEDRATEPTFTATEPRTAEGTGNEALSAKSRSPLPRPKDTKGLASAKPLFCLVAGEGFEPSTFGL
jgi:hypothetical protein